MALRTLSVCSGYGGLDLALGLALGGECRPACYVEREAFSAALLVERMADSTLGHAPVWDDLCTFDGRAWRGVVDLVVGGYPCQPYSQAGKRTGSEHESYLWPHVLRVLLESGAGLAFFENVRGHLKNGFPEVRADLERNGFRVEHVLLGAEDVGAPHGRKRLFILAYSDGAGLESLRRCGELVEGFWQAFRLHADGQGCPSACLREGVGQAAPAGIRRVQDVRSEETGGPHTDQRGPWVGLGDPPGSRLEGGHADRPDADELLPWPSGAPLEWPPGPDDTAAWAAALERRPDLEPSLRRVADGAAYRVDRLRALGNGVVPKQAAVAFCMLVRKALGILASP